MEGNIYIYINHVRRNIHTYTRVRVRARGVFNDSHRVNPNGLDQPSVPTSKRFFPAQRLSICYTTAGENSRIPLICAKTRSVRFPARKR